MKHLLEFDLDIDVFTIALVKLVDLGLEMSKTLTAQSALRQVEFTSTGFPVFSLVSCITIKNCHCSN